MVEVNDAHKHGRHEKEWLKSLRVMSNVEVFLPGRTDGHPAERTNTTVYTDPSRTHMDRNGDRTAILPDVWRYGLSFKIGQLCVSFL